MNKAQSMLEYTILLIIIIAALLTMQVYMKRGIQGRWKQAVDDLGEQYDANGYTGNVIYTLNTDSTSRLSVVFDPQGGVNGYSTYRNDTAYSVEKKEGNAVTAPSGL